MNKIMFLLLLYMINSTAQIWEPPVIIDPSNPQVGDVISVGVFEVFFPPCLTLPGQNQDGLTHLFEFNKNSIDFFVVNDLVPIIFCFPVPVNPAPREWYELGTLEAGTYSLNTFIAGVTTPLPIPDNYPFPFPPAFGSEIIFQVSTPQVINTNTNIGLLVLTIIILLLTSLYYRAN